MDIIYEDIERDIKITIDKSYNISFVEIANDALWGTDGVIYKMNRLEDEFKDLKNALFVSLFDHNELSAIYIINQKKVQTDNSFVDVFYGGILTVKPQKMNNGFATLILNKITDYINNKFDRFIIYAYVESANTRSKRTFQKAGYDCLTTFIATTHTRAYPKFNKNVSKVGYDDAKEVLNILKSQYSGYSFVDIEQSYKPENFYILKEDGRIKAGLQCLLLDWSFVNIGGTEGFILMKVIPYIPILRKVKNMRNLSFIKIGNAFMFDSKSFAKLLDSVLVLNNVNSIMTYSNRVSTVDLTIIKEMERGILSSIGSQVLLFYKSKNISKNELDKPQFISIVDF